MEMVGNHGPGETIRAGFLKQGGKSVNEPGTVIIVEKDGAALNATNDDVLQ